jgi:oligopeptidase B
MRGAGVPPVARRVPVVSTLHGERRVDEYAWLRERSSPDVVAYLEAENRYTEGILSPLAKLREGLFQEMLARIPQADVQVPWKRRGYFYYTRTEEGRQYPLHCRKRGSLEAGEEIVLDLNRLAKGKGFLSLGSFSPDDDARLLAYSTDDRGRGQYTLFVRDLATGQDREKVAERVTSTAWASDGQTLFYVVEEKATRRPYRLYRHLVGTTDHTLVYEERDQAFTLGVGRTRSGRYLLLGISSHSASETRLVAADAPLDEWRVVAPRVAQQEYEVDHEGERFLIRVNDRGRNFRLVSAPVASPDRSSWTELLPHRPEVLLEGVDCFRDFVVLSERERGLPRFRVVALPWGETHEISFAEAAYSASLGQNAEFETSLFRYSYQSLLTPASVFDYDVVHRESRLLKQEKVLGGYDRRDYVTERIFARAHDGTPIPISLAYRRGHVRDGSAPIHLAGYGSYGFPLPVSFSSNRLSLLDRGVVIALAHVRGGGEMGKGWHDEGRMQRKMNTFTDFIACAEHLFGEKYGAEDRLVIEGGSAGGLLVAAVVNLRPDLARAVVSKVPFVDVLNSMLDETLPLTVGEFEEWGNPRKAEDYGVMRRYCPYTNLERKAYPAMLVKTSFHDSQVMYWEPVKYVARLRTLKTDERPLLLHTNMAAGHGGASSRREALRETALDYAFILWQLGLVK